MEFPRHLHKPGGLYVVPENAGEYEQLKARGWLDLPPAHVEQPTPVLMHVALNEPVNATPIDVDQHDSGAPSLVAHLNATDAAKVIEAADAEQLAAIRAEETAGKARKGVLALIDVREADLLDD